ncbi:MAG: TonB-dependent receptor [Verrucomicrobiota bacterium JB022]|nr:TonB-dependent receptor [Verrucomicrobiota bacterium JB022]
MNLRKFTVLGSLAPLLATPLGAQSSADSEEILDLDAFEVVGSRIETVDLNTPSPVTFISGDQIADLGYVSLGDLVRNLPINTGSTIGIEGAAVGFSAGTAAINLRGLGNNNTLVLLDGRRSSPAGASGFDGFQTVFDFNSVPTALVESIQILKDAGSAVYGSDAVAGAVQVNLKERIKGTYVESSVGNSTEVYSPYYQSSLTHGVEMGKVDLLIHLDYRFQGRSKYRDRPFSRTGDQRWRGGLDLRSTTPYPARVSYFGNFYTAAEPTTEPRWDFDFGPAFGNVTAESNLEDPPRYDFNQDEDMFPESQNWGAFIRLRFDEDLEIEPFFDFSFRQNITDYIAAPVAFRNTLENGDGPDGQIVIPYENPYNPFGISIGFPDVLYEDIRWRLTELGNRRFHNVSNYTRALGGIKGEADLGRWETALLYARSDASYRTDHVVFDADLQAALNGTYPGWEGVYANPFGPSEPGLFEALDRSNTNEATFAMASWDGFITGDVMEVFDDKLRYATGFEIRSETLDDRRSEVSQTGQMVGGSEGAAFKASRDVYAAYVEASMPLPAAIELRAAARTEYYSDFGHTTKPKVAVAWTPLPRLTFRASYGGAFLAPNLPYLFTPQLTTFEPGLIPDPKRGGEPTQIQVVTGGDPDLEPEETWVTSAGVLWHARDDGTGFAVEATWFQFEQENLLRRFTAAFLVANEDSFPDSVVRAPLAPGAPPGSFGSIQYVRSTYQNVGEGLYRGYDLDLRYLFVFEGGSSLNLSSSLTYVDTLQFAEEQTLDDGSTRLVVSDYAGDYGNSRVRGNLSAAWRWNDWSASIFYNYIGAYDQQFEPGEVDADGRINLTLGHQNVFGWAVSVSIRNLLNEEPPLDLSRAEGYNMAVNSGESRFVTLKVSRAF